MFVLTIEARYRSVVESEIRHLASRLHETPEFAQDKAEGRCVIVVAQPNDTLHALVREIADAT